MNDIGRRLRRIRTLAGYGDGDGGQAKFCRTYGFHPATWNHWENQLFLPPVTSGIKIRAVLPGLTLDYIYLNNLDGLPSLLRERLGRMRSA